MSERIVLRVEFFEELDVVFEEITNFESLDSYTDQVRIATRGEGEGARCYFNFKKTVLDIPASYTARIRVTDYEENQHVSWKMTRDLDLDGQIKFSDSEDGTVVRMEFNIEPEDSDFGSLPIPSSASLSDALEFLLPKIRNEVNSLFEELVTQIEGNRRSPNVEVVESTVDEISGTI